MLFTEMERLALQVGVGGEQLGDKRIRISFLDSYIVCFYCGFKFKQSIFFFSCGNSFNWLNALTEYTSQNY